MIEAVAVGIDHAEGIAWSPHGYAVCGTERGDLLRIDTQTGTVEVLATIGEYLLGVAVDSIGRCYVCDPSNGVVWIIEPDGWVANKMVPADTFRVPNACDVDIAGALYVTDSGSCWDEADGTISRIDADGTVKVLATRLAFPNGLHIDGTELYVVESFPPALTCYTIEPNGDLGSRQVISELPDAVPDGVHRASEVTYVTYYRPDRIVAVTSEDVRTVADDPQGRLLQGPSNCCLEGTGPRLLVANTSGTVIAAVTDEAML